MPDFTVRSYEPEIMDTQNIDFNEFSCYLSHLEYINRISLAYSPALHWLKEKHLSHSSKQWTILDVGSGRGDMARQIWHFSKINKFKVKIIGIDVNFCATQAARQVVPANAPLHFKTKNVFTYVPKTKPDYILSIQFTHHLNDEDLVTFIKWLDNNSKYGWFINDLHRHPIPYYFIKLIFHLLPVHRFAKYDGPLSITKAFTKNDWHYFLKKAGIEPVRARIKWHFPFRYSIACDKSKIDNDI
jgi:2-polyprenyl-3-methyl-5-hydroxy-6-metoxy-1,4-benzoquinol methylase